MTHHSLVRTPSVVAYFGDDPDRVYQLEQWLPVLELLDTSEPVAVVLRQEDTGAVVRALTDLPVLVAEDFGELRELYAELDAKVVLYCNNSMRNFQSLLEPLMLHVHINHGESDKQSMASNNAKSYDRVFVAGDAAVQRIERGLLEFDTSKLVRIGRPQLDLRREPVLAPSERRTLLYAPTWEGDADYNNYSSVDRFGPELVRRLLAVPDVRVVYKPHPRIETSEDPAVLDGAPRDRRAARGGRGARLPARGGHPRGDAGLRRDGHRRLVGRAWTGSTWPPTGRCSSPTATTTPSGSGSRPRSAGAPTSWTPRASRG